MNRKLDELKAALEPMTIHFQEQHLDIKEAFTRTEGAMATVFTIHSHIEQYRQQAKLARYLDVITTEYVASVPPTYYDVDIDSIKESILKNLITERYEEAKKAFSYWSFPFQCDHIKHLTMSEEKLNEVGGIQNLTTQYGENLAHLLEIIRNQDIIVSDEANYWQNYVFEKHNAFYTWTMSTSAPQIRKLLSGRRAMLYADVGKAPFDAVKFRTLYLEVSVARNDTNARLQKILEENINVELEHSGVSNYVVNKTNYTINTNYNSENKLKLVFNYGCQQFGRSNDRNTKICYNANWSFEMLAKARRPILSPYTLWSAKLVVIDPSKNKTVLFNQIEAIIGEEPSVADSLVVSLKGSGKYLRHSDDLSDENRLELDLSCFDSNRRL